MNRRSHDRSNLSAGADSSTTPPPAPVDRITVALVRKAWEDLQVLQDRTDLSKTDIVNRAISLYEFIDAELSAGADLIVRRDGKDHLIKLL